MNKRDIFIVTSVAVSFVAGSGVGYFLAEKKLVKKFDEILEAELANTRKFYERKNKVGDFETPEAAVEALGIPDGPVEEAADAIVNYAAKFVPAEEVLITNDGVLIPDRPVEEDTHNVFGKEPGEPVQITFDEFAQIGDDYDSESVTYYMVDRVVADVGDHPIEDDHRCVGLENLELFHQDESITEIYVQNDRLKTVYEISRSTGSFAKDVLDLDVPDSLEHAEIFSKMPRKRRLQDD